MTTYTCSICGPVCIHMRQTNEAEHARINVTLQYRHGWMDPRKVFAIVDRHDDGDEDNVGFSRIEDGCSNCRVILEKDPIRLGPVALVQRDGYWVCPVCGGSYGKA